MKNKLNATLRHQIHIERLKTHEAKKLVSAIQQSTAVVIQLIKSLEVDNLSDLRKVELTKLLKDARDRQREIIDRAVARYEKKMQEIADYEAKFEAKLNGENPVLKAGAAYSAALKNPIKATGQMLETFIRDWTKKEIAAVEGAIRVAYTEGQSVNQAVAAIRGTRAARYKDGIMQIAKRHAEAIVRTSMQHVVSQSKLATWEKMPKVVDRYQWISTLDSRTTDICQGLSNEIFEVGKGPMPPAHVNCRSTVIPLSKNDEPPDTPSYYEWLKKQPKSIQEDVLGVERAKLFRVGGMSAEEFRKFNIGRNLEQLSLDELRKREPDVFKRAGL